MSDVRAPIRGRAARLLVAALAPAAGLCAAQTVPSEAQRIAAAQATATSPSNACERAAPFYWEVGDRSGRKAWGSVNSPRSTTTYGSGTVMQFASASKWLYAAYVAERRGGTLTSADLESLRHLSGYTNLQRCTPSQATVKACFEFRGNEKYVAGNDGKFFYNGGHMQQHAVDLGLGGLDRAGLAAEMQARLGTDITIGFERTLIAGSATGTPAVYARFLRKLMKNELELGAMLGRDPVCADPARCPTTAIFTAAPQGESWDYSIGHWVERDPVVGDGAFSAPGSLGFYPWIDSSRTWYGLTAKVMATGAVASTDCGRAIRKAWITGVAQ
jgi:hypothetical protein